jgi:hypothetical protein
MKWFFCKAAMGSEPFKQETYSSTTCKFDAILKEKNRDDCSTGR